MNINPKEAYRQLCETEADIIVFSQAWWLDALVGKENWDVVLEWSDGKIIGALPFVLKSKWGFSIITMPRFTSMIQLWIKKNPLHQASNALKHERIVSEALIKQLPVVASFSMNIHYSYSQWLPFHWSKYTETSRYTFVLPDLRNTEFIVENFEHSKRKNIKRAEEILQIKEDLAPEKFYEFHRQCLNKAGKSIDYNLEYFLNFYTEAKQKNAGKIFYAIDAENQIHSAIFAVWNKACAFNLIQPIDPEHRNSGSASLMTKTMIQFLADKSSCYDFEGSMDKDISESFRRFGAEPRLYYQISKKNFLFRLYDVIK